MSTICYYLLSHIEHQISSNINIYLWNDLGWPMRPIYPKKCGGFITLKPNHFSINIPETSHIPHVLFFFNGYFLLHEINHSSTSIRLLQETWAGYSGACVLARNGWTTPLILGICWGYTNPS